ncbi:Rv1733c family protein [Streptomyces sp. NPDC001714]|uniref:Rv1733c family protein n=1 Tax=Streptomyces sp. NPDC001714 TaxID=3364603 RepID=UPI003679052C
MTGTSPGRVTGGPFWRWRRNPLRRPSDVVEAWVVLAVWAVTVVGGLLAGWAAGAAVDHMFAERRAALHVVSAELTENAANGAPVAAGYDVAKVWVTVRWTTTDGSVHTGLAKAVPTATAGSRLQVWVDRGERVAAPPTSRSEATLDAVAAAALVAPLAATAAWGAGWALRSRLMRRRLAEWDAEWRRIGPQWRNFSGGKG